MARTRHLLSAVLVAVVVAASALAFVNPFGSLLAQGLPRNETIYIGGGLWAPPSNFNPLTPWAAATGTVGLIYEPLFLYQPLTNKFIPWLAESGKWLNKTVFIIKLRKAWWSDGKPLTAWDVKFTFELAKKYPLYYSDIWSYLKEIKVINNRTVEFIFKKWPNYPEWYYYLYDVVIIPKHIWEHIKNPLKYANTHPIGSGMYKLLRYDQNEVIYVRNDNWWGKNIFGLPKPKYIVYLRVTSNNVALAMLIRGELDWSNFFLPGIPELISKYSFIKTWYSKPPYNLPANVVFLFLNDQKYPLNLSEFRKAIAYAINVKAIIQRVYEGGVLPSNPLGFLPIPSWMKFYNKTLVEKYGFTYNPKKAEEILDKLGFKDVNHDGYRELPNGTAFKLTIIVPYGWTDWMEAARIIAEDLAKVGIDVVPKFPDYSKYYDDLVRGHFDMALNNFGSFMSPSPWTLYSWLFYPPLPIGQPSYSGNFGRYNNTEIEQLLHEIASTPLNDTAKLKVLYSKVEKIFLQQLPYIPLWYNAYWFQASTLHWIGWPSAKNPYAIPVTWPGQWQLGGMLVLLHLQPATAKTSTTTSTTTTTVVKTTTTPVTTTKTVTKVKVSTTSTTATITKTKVVTKTMVPSAVVTKTVITTVKPTTIIKTVTTTSPVSIAAIVIAIIAIIIAGVAIGMARRR